MYQPAFANAQIITLYVYNLKPYTPIFKSNESKQKHLIQINIKTANLNGIKDEQQQEY